MKIQNAIIFLLRLTVLLLSVLSVRAQEATQLDNHSSAQQIDAFIEHNAANAHVGVLIMDAKTGQILYQHNGYRKYTPASTTKLLTAAAALYYLTPEYQYKTTVYAKKNTLQNNVVQGDVYIKFTGDPSLGKKDIGALIQELSKKKIKTVKGNIILDTSTFTGSPYPQGMVMQDAQWSYGAPVTAIILDRNAIPISVIPGKTLNQPVRISVSESYQSHIPLTSSVNTVTWPQAEKECAFDVLMDNANSVHIDGCWPVNKTSYLKIAVQNPYILATQIIENTLKTSGIQFSGSIRTGVIPPQTEVLAEHASSPLSRLIGHMLNFSDNLYANALLKTLGSQYSQEGSFLMGIKALKSILAKHTDIDFTQMTLRDGAGESVYNLISPYQLNQLLHAVYHSPGIKGAVLDALAKPETNGTLKRRMHSFGLLKGVRAKTGSMTGVSSVSGYLTASDRRELIFAIMVNNYTDDADQIRTFEDQLTALVHGMKFQ